MIRQKLFIFQHYAQFELQESDNHKDLYKAMTEWKESLHSRPQVSISMSVGNPTGGPDITQNFLADPFHVSV